MKLPKVSFRIGAIKQKLNPLHQPEALYVIAWVNYYAIRSKFTKRKELATIICVNQIFHVYSW